MDELIDDLKDKLDNIHYRMPENAWEKFKQAEQSSRPEALPELLPDPEESEPFPNPGFWASRIGKIVKLSLTSLSAAASVAITVYVSVPKKHVDKPIVVSVAPRPHVLPKRIDLVRPKNVETLKITPTVVVQQSLILQNRQLPPVIVASPEIAAHSTRFILSLSGVEKTAPMGPLQVTVRVKNEILYGLGFEKIMTGSGGLSFMQSGPKSGFGSSLYSGYSNGSERSLSSTITNIDRTAIDNQIRDTEIALPINNSLALQSSRTTLNPDIDNLAATVAVQNDIPPRGFSAGQETSVNASQGNRPTEVPPRTVEGPVGTTAGSEAERTEAVRDGSATINAPAKGNTDKLLNLKYYNFSIEFQQKLKSKKSIGVAPFLQVPASGFSDTQYFQYNRYGLRLTLSF